MNRLISLVGVASLAASMALAQGNAYMPLGSNTADGGGTSQNYFRETAARWQSVYDSSVFTGQGIFSPIQIDTISFRPAAGQTVPAVPYTYSNAEVYVQYSATDYLAQGSQWAVNRTVPQPSTPNYLGSITVNTPTGASPVNSDDVVITLTTPFVYDPSLGQDLLLEIYLPTVPSPLPVLATDVPVRTCAYPIASTFISTVRVVGATAPTATGGALTNFTPVTKFGYSVPAGVAKHDPYGGGCYTIARSFYEVFPGAYPASTNDLSGNTVMATQNGNGGYIAMTMPGASVVLPSSTGLALGDDVVSAAITLPFTFDFPGGSTNTIYVDSNGSIVLGGAAAPTSSNNPANGAALLTSVAPRIAASLQDLLPDGATNVANVFAEVNPNNPNEFLITWLNVPCFQTTPSVPQLTSTFQIALIDAGQADSFELRYQTLVNDSDSYGGAALTGFSLGNGAMNGGSKDLTAAPIITYPDFGGLTLSGSPRPVMGQQVHYNVGNIRAGGLTLMECSFGQDALGTPLQLYGVDAPGCNAHISFPLASFGGLLFGSPSDSFSFTWPTGYQGFLVYVQAFELELLSPENNAGVIASNGLKVELGIY